MNFPHNLIVFYSLLLNSHMTGAVGVAAVPVDAGADTEIAV
ncbi:hypothetical protein [Caproiciproducens sp.]|nr:hypothetical protein [Caproiciproducens sp.]